MLELPRKPLLAAGRLIAYSLCYKLVVLVLRYSVFNFYSIVFLTVCRSGKGLEGSLAKFGWGVGFVRFANVPDSEGTCILDYALLSELL
jgi:hypothetical protein